MPYLSKHTRQLYQWKDSYASNLILFEIKFHSSLSYNLP